MKDLVIQAAYKILRDVFRQEVLPTNWIWIDYFEDQGGGFEYFRETVYKDVDFQYLDQMDAEKEISDYACDLADDIYSKLSRSNMFHTMHQTFLSYPL